MFPDDCLLLVTVQRSNGAKPDENLWLICSDIFDADRKLTEIESGLNKAWDRITKWALLKTSVLSTGPKEKAPSEDEALRRREFCASQAAQSALRCLSRGLED